MFTSRGYLYALVVPDLASLYTVFTVLCLIIKLYWALFTSRLSRSPVKLEGIESVHFRGPSHVGERVSLQSSVNRIFSGNRFAVEYFSICVIYSRQKLVFSISSHSFGLCFFEHLSVYL